MTLARSAALAAALLALVCAGAFACASKERKASATSSDDDAPVADTREGAARSDGPRAPAAPVDPFEGISGDPSVTFAGDEALLRDTLAEELALPAFDVACMRGEDPLGAPATVDERFEHLAGEQSVALGRVRFVRIESDPTRGAASARLCRPVREDALLHAPLFREKEPASTWLVEGEADVPAAVRALLLRAAGQHAKAAGPPRAIVVRGKVVGVALPVVRQGA